GLPGMDAACQPPAGSFDRAWSQGLPATLAFIWSLLPRLESWNPAGGWQAASMPGNPYPSAYLLALLLLGRLPDGSWASADALEQWLVKRHPYWSGGTAIAMSDDKSGHARSDEPVVGITRFLLGVAYPLRLLQAARDSAGNRVVRLS